MDKTVLDYLGNGKLQLRKWWTIEIIGGSSSSALRQVSLQSVVNSRIHLRPIEVMKSYTRQENNSYIKELETSITLWTCSRKTEASIIPTLKT